MQKLTIIQAAEHFNVSKEAIHNRIRRGTLNCVIESGIKYVVLDAPEQESSEQINNQAINDKYYNYIEEENQRLKEKIEKLESETKNLRDQKEQMLIQERDKIEQIYKERDDQLKNVLNVVANKFLAHINTDSLLDEVDENKKVIKDVEEAVVVEVKEDWLSLKEFLKLKNLSEKKYEKLKKRFQKVAKDDTRFKVEGKKIYLLPNTFDYSDILK